MKKREASQWLKASGEAVDVFPDGKAWTLKELQLMVGGYIELIGRTNLPKGRIMLANEDGRAMGKKVNAKASMIAGQTIVGDVIVVPRKEFK